MSFHRFACAGAVSLLCLGGCHDKGEETLAGTGTVSFDLIRNADDECKYSYEYTKDEHDAWMADHGVRKDSAKYNYYVEDITITTTSAEAPDLVWLDAEGVPGYTGTDKLGSTADITDGWKAENFADPPFEASYNIIGTWVATLHFDVPTEDHEEKCKAQPDKLKIIFDVSWD